MTSLKDLLATDAAAAVVAVPVPEWGGRTVYVGPIPLSGVVALQGIDGTRDQADYAARAVVAGCREADGSPAFTLDDLALVKRLPGLGTLRVAKAVMTANKLDESEDAAKNA